MKRWLLAALMFVSALAHAQYVTLTGSIQGANGTSASNYTLSFTPSQTMYVAGTGVFIGNTTTCATSVDGSVVGLPNPLQAAVVSPQYSGTLPAGNYYVTYTFYGTGTLGGETLPSPEVIAQLTSTGQLTLASPAQGIPAGAAGMRVYIGTAPGTETLQGETTGTTGFVQAAPLVAGVSAPTVNSSTCQQIANDAGWPTGTGYNVSLTDAAGNAVPGYPMQWQLLGPNSTINLSSGLPYYHGVVTFPSPILATPYNHATQSISGSLNMGGYSITNVGALNAGQINGTVVASLQPGSDIGQKVNQSFVTCGYQCIVYVPAGTYNFTTTIQMPLNQFSTYSLLLDPGAVLIYKGAGDAISLNVAGTGPTEGNCHVSGGQIYGTAAGQSGVHLWPTNTCNIQNMLIASFSNGYGIWVDGANMVNIDHNLIFGNKSGVYLTNTFCNGATCNDLGTGSPYTPNAIYIQNNGIFSNSQWGVNSFSPQTGSNPGPLNITIANNDLELNGGAGVTYGAITFGRSRNLTIRENYFEGSPLGIVLGIPGGNDGTTRFFASIGTIMRDNYFTLEDTQNPAGSYSIDMLDTADAIIEGNSTQGASENSSSCFINSLARTGSNIGETGTYLSKNHFETDENTNAGNYTCVGGAASNLVGTGTFSIINNNYVPVVVNLNYAITSSGTSETVAVSGNVVNGSQCFVVPFNTTAWNNATSPTINPSAFIATGTNTGTLYHPASVVGLRVSILCAPGPFN